MQKNDDRILAYQLAKEIDIKELDEVSGGSFQQTLQVTGNSSSPDGAGDVRVDW